MADSKESFPRLLDETYYHRLRNAIAELKLPDSAEISQHDKKVLDMVCETLNWMDASEERIYTGDPVALPPDYPIVPMLLERLGLLESPTDK